MASRPPSAIPTSAAPAPSTVAPYGTYQGQLVGAGDIASCRDTGAIVTAQLLDVIPGTVFTLGDNAYDSGAAVEFSTCYGATWGRHKSRTRPAIGNHEYITPNASGYFDYFGGAAGPRGLGYYSYDIGSWHVVVLNSECGAVGGCAAGSQMEQWLRHDLDASRSKCTLAYQHIPPFSSGYDGDRPELLPLFSVLVEYQVELLLAGHAHDYERFLPQTPGRSASDAGVRVIIAGTGGKGFTPFVSRSANSELFNNDTLGVLIVTLFADGYVWEFRGAGPGRFADRGSAACH